MRKSNIILTAAFALMLCACSTSSNKNEQSNATDSAGVQSTAMEQIFNLDTTILASGATFYQCEMDPEVLSDNPGSCPKCGMYLSARKKN